MAMAQQVAHTTYLYTSTGSGLGHGERGEALKEPKLKTPGVGTYNLSNNLGDGKKMR